MGTNRNRGTLTIAAATLLAGALVGCNNGSPDVSAPSASRSSGMTSASPTSSASTSSAANSRTSGDSATASSTATLSADELQAKIVAGTPPKDLAWQYFKPPSSWKKLKTDNGTLQWQVKGRCVLTLDQPAGLGTDPEPTSHDVLKSTAEQTSTAFDSAPTPRYHDQKTRLVQNDVTGFSGKTKVQMQESLVDYGKSIRSRIVAYRKGDFALTVTSVCGTPALFKSASKSDLDPFINKLRAHTTY